MDFKDYYATLQVEPGASAEEIKRSYRKLARKYHPDVSKEPEAEARFKDVAEAYKALKDPEKRAAYDAVAQRYRQGERFDPPPGWDSGFEFRGRGADSGAARPQFHAEDVSEFFASLFGRAQRGAHAEHPERADDAAFAQGGGADRHAKITIDLADVFQGAKRTVSLQVPRVDAQGRVTLHERQLEIQIPRGIRAGQNLRLAGQGDPGSGQHPAGDLYLEIELRPHPTYRVDGRDVYVELPVAPWEAALGAQVTTPTPDGPVQLSVPPGSAPGRSLRLKGRGVPGNPPGDLYARLALALPAADSDQAKAAYAALAHAFPGFAPRETMEA
jgi:curved DNA-binding protein